MTDPGEIGRIRKECAEVRVSGWHGDYPVEDVELLLAALDEAKHGLLAQQRLNNDAYERGRKIGYEDGYASAWEDM